MEGFYVQEHSDINGRGVWRYLVVTPIGNINVVQYEEKGKELKTFLYEERLEKAEAKYKSVAKGILNGTL